MRVGVSHHAALARALFMLALGGATLLPLRGQGQVFSPGKLARPHSALNDKCTSCHAGGSGEVRPRECLKCHSELANRIKLGIGYHGKLKNPQCAICHKEHQGPNYQLIKWPGGRAAFKHSISGFALKGKHARLKCESCHQPKNHRSSTVSRFSKSRKSRTFLGLEPKCWACHKTPHDSTVSTNCQSCHSEKGFKPVLRFADHDRSDFPLRGIHKQLDCADCHKKQGKWMFNGTPKDCDGCHKAPHRGVMGQGTGKPLACQSCHQPDGWDKVALKRADHPSVVPLTGGHAKVPCTKCHGAQGNKKPKGRQCATCHPDTHQKKFGKACAKCHGARTWKVRRGKIPTGPMTSSQRDSALHAKVPLAKLKAVSFHNRTHFPLTGKHITVSCKKCHRKGQRRGQKSRMKFTRGYASCIDCHKDEHKGQFSQHITVNSQRATSCEYCHPRGGLWTTSFTAEQHKVSRFPLRGAHRAVACSKCHSRRRGKAKRFSFPDLDCRACHRDKHRGKFRLSVKDKRPRCATCHQETAFSPVAFDHDKTSFPLRHRHAKISCTSCHKPDKRGVTLFRGLDKSCASCHKDPHKGQFARNGASTRCEQCHSTGGFSIKNFDHDRLTRFPLKGKHKQKKCNDCHQRVTLKGGVQTTLYRGVGTACTQCHHSRHEHLFTSKKTKTKANIKATKATTHGAGKGTHGAGDRKKVKTQRSHRDKAALARTFKDCQRCHEANSWRRIKPRVAGFNHEQVGHTLRGRHRSAPCSGCHTGQRAVSRQCSTCHSDPHRGRLGSSCSECHEPSSWKPSAALARHRKTRLPLTGWHALTDCSSCHPRAREGYYRGTPASCYGCHARDYHNPQTHPNHVQAKFDTRCEQCHRPTGWRPAVWVARSQSALRGSHPFPLAGRHAQLSCLSCHRGSRRPSRLCVSCHQQDQRSARSPDHRAAGFPTACERCHSATSWSPAKATSHGKAFPLVGRHRALQCADCHRDSTNFRRADCVPCHQQAEMTRRHRRTAGFVYSSQACKRCHPFGRR